MEISGIIDNGLIDQAVKETKVEGTLNDGTSFDPNMFLKILMAQLQNQTPFDTVDTSEILQQQATLTQVEQSAKQSGFLDTINNSLAGNFALLNDTLTEIRDKL